MPGQWISLWRAVRRSCTWDPVALAILTTNMRNAGRGQDRRGSNRGASQRGTEAHHVRILLELRIQVLC